MTRLGPQHALPGAPPPAIGLARIVQALVRWAMGRPSESPALQALRGRYVSGRVGGDVVDLPAPGAPRPDGRR